MSDSEQFPPNPNYGSGCFRRRILISQQGEQVSGLLEDTHHGFSVIVSFEKHRVSNIEASSRRTPFNTCPDAISKLSPLLNLDCSQALNSKELNLIANARANCTHLLDLSILAILFYQPENANSEELRERQFDVMISDADQHGSDCQVHCDGELMHRWQAKSFQIEHPQELAGKPLYSGFAQWANKHFQDELSNQTAFILQKGYFVAQARLFDIDALAGESATNHSSMAGACYTYQPEVAAVATRLAKTTRDFSHNTSQLLKFT